MDYAQPNMNMFPLATIDNTQHVQLPPGFEPLLRLVDQQFREQLQPIHAEIRSLQEQIALLRRGQRTRKKSQLTEEERESCLDVYQICLRAVKQNLSDLPIVRGNPEASNRVDNLVEELYNSYDEVRKAVDSDPPILTKNDIRLHVLNVMAEQRRKRKSSDILPNPTKRKRLDQTDDEEEEDGLGHHDFGTLHHQNNQNNNHQLITQNIDMMQNHENRLPHVYSS